MFTYEREQNGSEKEKSSANIEFKSDWCVIFS